MSKILCLDYDNTIFDHSSNQIPNSTLEAIDHVRDRCKIVLASGRYFNETINQTIKVLIKPDAIIHANGCVVEADNIILYETYLESTVVADLIRFSREHNLCLGGLYEGSWYSTNPHKLKQRWSTSKNKPFQDIKDARELIGRKIYSLYLNDSVEAAKLLEENFPAIRAPIMSDKTGGADVIPRHISKAFGAQILLDHWNMTFLDVIAIGDSMNDYELIRQASVGIAMGNAVAALKEIADYVTTPVWEDGIKNALEGLSII